MTDARTTRNAWESDPVVDAGYAIVLGAGLPLPPILQPSGNPQSGGLYPLGRKYSVGDEFRLRRSDAMTGAVMGEPTIRVTKVDADEDRVYVNDGQIVYDTMGNWIRLGNIEFLQPKQMLPAELQVGRRWTAVYTVRRDGQVAAPSRMQFQIAARETVKVPAGTFDAFRIEGKGWSESSQLEEKLWVMPWLNLYVRYERFGRDTAINSRIFSERYEVISARQRAIDPAWFR